MFSVGRRLNEESSNSIGSQYFVMVLNHSFCPLVPLGAYPLNGSEVSFSKPST
jgi:hypothetical protein